MNTSHRVYVTLKNGEYYLYAFETWQEAQALMVRLEMEDIVSNTRYSGNKATENTKQ